MTVVDGAKRTVRGGSLGGRRAWRAPWMMRAVVEGAYTRQPGELHVYRWFLHVDGSLRPAWFLAPTLGLTDALGCPVVRDPRAWAALLRDDAGCGPQYDPHGLLAALGDTHWRALARARDADGRGYALWWTATTGPLVCRERDDAGLWSWSDDPAGDPQRGLPLLPPTDPGGNLPAGADTVLALACGAAATLRRHLDGLRLSLEGPALYTDAEIRGQRDAVAARLAARRADPDPLARLARRLEVAACPPRHAFATGTAGQGRSGLWTPSCSAVPVQARTLYVVGQRIQALALAANA